MTMLVINIVAAFVWWSAGFAAGYVCGKRRPAVRPKQWVSTNLPFSNETLQAAVDAKGEAQ